jgi:hypothetical protein
MALGDQKCIGALDHFLVVENSHECDPFMSCDAVSNREGQVNLFYVFIYPGNLPVFTRKININPL